MKLFLVATLLLQDATIEQLIQRLGADDVDDRNNATQEVRKRGLAAVPLLKAAAEGKEAEVVTRAREALGMILDDAGNATLKSLEDAVDKAASIRIDSRTVVAKDPIISFTAQGTLLRQRGGKILATDEGRVSEGTWKGFLVSDGERMMLETSSLRIGNRAWGYDADYWPTVRAAVARVGAVTTTHLWAYVRLDDKPVAELFRHGDWSFEEEGKLRVLGYTVRWTGKATLAVPSPLKTKVWYDPTTSRPVKRESSFSTLKGGPTVIEEFSYDMAIPAEKFRVPEGKAK